MTNETSSNENPTWIDNEFLYSCEHKVKPEDLASGAQYLEKWYDALARRGSILAVCFSLLIAIATKEISIGIAFFVILEIIILIMYRVKLEKYITNFYKRTMNSAEVEEPIITKLYPDYFIREKNNSIFKFNYDEITKWVELEKGLYVQVNKKIIYLSKQDASPQMYDFFKSELDSMKNVDDKAAKKTLNATDNIKREKRLRNLFILTILSLFIPIIISSYKQEISNGHGIGFIRDLWICWCLLIFPVLSIIFGLKYKKYGIKCTKNIVFGLIAGIFLFVYGLLGIIVTRDYSSKKLTDEELQKITYYIDEQLPQIAGIDREDYSKFYVDEITNYTMTGLYFSGADSAAIKEFENNIKNNEKWSSGDSLKTAMKVFEPFQFHVDKDGYYLFYNATSDEYNTLPKESGVYEIYAVGYSTGSERLEIHNYKMVYK